MIEMTLSVTVLITVFCLGRVLPKNKLSPRLMYACRLIVAVRLLLPWQIPIAAAPQTVFLTDLSQTVRLPLPAALPTANAAASAQISVKSAVAGIWRAGSIAVCLCFALSRYRLSRRLKQGRVRLTVVSRVPVYATSNAVAPCTFGAFRPVIYVPESTVGDENAFACILAHEQAHSVKKTGFGVFCAWRAWSCGGFTRRFGFAPSCHSRMRKSVAMTAHCKRSAGNKRRLTAAYCSI